MSARSIIYEIESLEKEIEYYKKSLKEAQRVIQQLAFGVPEGEAELIHPADMMEIYERCDRVFVDLSPAEPLDPPCRSSWREQVSAIYLRSEAHEEYSLRKP